MGDEVLVERRPPVFTVTIARGKANAIDAATSREMSEIFEEFRDDAAFRVAILTGAGERFFSAGWDLNAATEGESYEADYGSGGFGGFAELPHRNKPVIAAVNGIAAGGGFEMVLAADLVVSVSHAEFLLPEARVGIIPDVGTVRLPRVLPSVIANEVMLAGRRLSADEALGFGLVNRVVASAALMEAATDMANEVIASAPLAVAAIMDLRRRSEHLSVTDALSLMRSGDVDTYDSMLASADAQEGPRAFVEKRNPKWTGG